MSGRTTNESIQECSLADRILLTYGEADEETIRLTLSSMPSISHQDDIYYLKGCESLLFASEYASLCPFIRSIAIAGSMASGGFSEEDYILRQKPYALFGGRI